MRPINRLAAGGLKFGAEPKDHAPAKPAFGRPLPKEKRYSRIEEIPKSDIDALIESIIDDVTMPGSPRVLVNGGRVHAKKLLHRRLVDMLGMNPKDILKIIQEDEYVPFLREVLDRRLTRITGQNG